MIQITATFWLDPATGVAVRDDAGDTVVYFGGQTIRIPATAASEIVERLGGAGKDADAMEAVKALKRVTAASTLADAKRIATEELRRRFADWQQIKG